MKLRIIDCLCDNPRSHKKWETEDGGRTEGFFSIAQGNSLLKSFAASAEFTPNEIANARTELASCGLPADPPDATEEELVRTAASLIISELAEEREAFVLIEVEHGTMSQKSVARIRELLKNEASTLYAADVEDMVDALSCASVRSRDEEIADAVRSGVINSKQAELIRKKMVGIPVSVDFGREAEANERLLERALYRSGFGSGGIDVMEEEISGGGGSVSMN